MKILITGATGFVGSSVFSTLSKNYQLMYISSKNNPTFEIGNYLFSNDVEFNRKIKDFNPEIVIHFASFSTPERHEDAIDNLVSSNITFGIKLLNALSSTSVKYFLSTGTFAEFNNDYTKINNSYLYSTTKTAFRLFVDFYQKIIPFIHFNIIPFTVYGKKSKSKKAIDIIIDSILTGVGADMSSGKQELDFIHIDDVTDFYLNLVNKIQEISPLENSNIFLGTGNTSNLRFIASELAKLLKKDDNINWGKKTYREFDTMIARAPLNLNPSWLDWKPRIDIKAGIKMYLENYYGIKN